MRTLSGQALSHRDLKTLGASWKWALTSLVFSFTGKEEVWCHNTDLHVSQLVKTIVHISS